MTDIEVGEVNLRPPTLFNEYSAKYRNYVVLSSKITVRFFAGYSTTNYTTRPLQYYGGTVSAKQLGRIPEELATSRDFRCRYKNPQPFGYQYDSINTTVNPNLINYTVLPKRYVHTMKLRYSPKRMHGSSPVNNQNLYSENGEEPNEVDFFQLGVNCMRPTSTGFESVTWDCNFQIQYTVLWTEKNPQ